MPVFSHLHCHTQYSLLDGAAPIKDMVAKAQKDGMPAVALTDHGNMFGAFEFVNAAQKAGIIPVVGCEFYVVEDRFQRTFTKEQKDKRYHQLLLAKNQEGYRNLSKLCSLGFIEGLYGKFPRVDKSLIKQYKEGLIATTCCIGAEVPQAIIFKGEAVAERVFLEWLDIFGEDYFIELQRHDLKDIDGTGISQEDVNQVLLKWSKKYNVPVIATNDSHYVDEANADAHDILLCVNTGDKRSTPVGEGKGYRFGFPNNQFFFKTQAQMEALFQDVPQALDNTNLIIDRITPPKLKRDVLLPNYILPEGFATQDDYLHYLAFEGAKKKYGEIDSTLEERLNYELSVIKEVGFPGYFLIVQDFTNAARAMNIAVGPGRGSAAGSAVAYAIGITNIDPIRYNLLFERFLNPERVAMPDIDIDFDDEGRDKIIDYVVKKYGERQVAQIITYGTMASKSSIRDVGRVLDLPLPETDRIAKLVPSHSDFDLTDYLEGDTEKLKEKLKNEQAMEHIKMLRQIAEGKDLRAQVLREAKTLEGSVRSTGLHACGIIISPSDIVEYIPVCTNKESNLLVTQYDNSLVESAGLLKMDFLGLKTLTIIRDAIENISKQHQIPPINPDEIPLTDEKTYQLFQNGDTIGIFQFESPGMQKYLRDLKPNNIEDLIAMNALYRPGPMEFIPSFINRKHGRETVEYPHPWLEELLQPTYGIMVYQEQIMRAAQIMADYTLGAADILRRAMGKKKPEEMAKQRSVFLEGAMKKGVAEKKANEIFDMMERFAAYGFNRSHSAAYSLLAFQTAYLKAHYPAEFMAAVLTHNKDNTKDLNFFLTECNNMNITALVPDLNESALHFTVNKKGQIRFGLAAVKGVGEAAVEEIISVRNEGGAFKNVFDFAKRVNLRTVNKKSFENLCAAGAFDSFGLPRAQYLADNNGSNGIETILRYGNTLQQQKESAQISLFGGGSDQDIPEPKLPQVEEFGLIEKLNREKEVTGIYLSGHPLQRYQREINCCCNCTLDELDNFHQKEVRFAAMVTKSQHRVSAGGSNYGTFTVEDTNSTLHLNLFKEDYLKYKHFFEEGTLLHIRGVYQEQRWGGDAAKYEVKINEVRLLDDVWRDIKYLTLHINLHDIQENWLQTMDNLFEKYAGNLQVTIEIADDRQQIQLKSPQRKLAYHPELFAQLDRMKQIAYAVKVKE